MGRRGISLYDRVCLNGNVMPLREAIDTGLVSVDATHTHLGGPYFAEIVDRPGTGFTIKRSDYEQIVREKAEQRCIERAQAQLASIGEYNVVLQSTRDLWPAMRVGTILERIPVATSRNQDAFPVVVRQSGISVAIGSRLDQPWTRTSTSFRWERWALRDLRLEGPNLFTVLDEGVPLVQYRVLFVPGNADADAA